MSFIEIFGFHLHLDGTTLQFDLSKKEGSVAGARLVGGVLAFPLGWYLLTMNESLPLRKAGSDIVNLAARFCCGLKVVQDRQGSCRET